MARFRIANRTHKRRKTRRRSAPRRTIIAVRSNPKRRRRRSVALAGPAPAVRRSRRRRRFAGVRKFAGNVRRRHSRRWASQSRGFNVMQFATQKLLPASVGAAGALALDLGWSYLPLPDALKTGPIAPVTRIAGAVAIGYGATMLFGRRIGEEALNGALIVTLYDIAKPYVAGQFPNLQ